MKPSSVVMVAVGVALLCALGVSYSLTTGTPSVPPESLLSAADQIAAIEVETSHLLAADVALGRLLADTTRWNSVIRNLELERIDAVWEPTKAAQRLAELRDALTLVVDDTSYYPYDDNRFVVSQWQSVEIAGNRAHVLLIGRDEYRLGSEPWQVDQDAQWEVDLVNIPDVGWRLQDRSAATMPSGPTGR